jgi:hypothetical protein
VIIVSTYLRQARAEILSALQDKILASIGAIINCVQSDDLIQDAEQLILTLNSAST